MTNRYVPLDNDVDGNTIGHGLMLRYINDHPVSIFPFMRRASTTNSSIFGNNARISIVKADATSKSGHAF